MKNLKIGFNPEAPALSQSQYPCMSYAYVDSIRKSAPHIWSSTTSELANDSFDLWTLYESGVRDESTLKWVKSREKYASKHYMDTKNLIAAKVTETNAYQVINLLKWGVISVLGLERTKKVVADLMELDLSLIHI